MRNPSVPARSVLASGRFFGDRSLTVSAGGFRAGLWRATVPAEQVQPHVHEDAHFILALDAGYHSLAHDPSTPEGQGLAAGALIWNPPGVEHRDHFSITGGRFLSLSFAPPPAMPQDQPIRLRQAIAETAARLMVGQLAHSVNGAELLIEGLALDMAGSVLAAHTLGEDPAPEWLELAAQALGDLASRPGLEVRDIAGMIGVHPVSLARRYRRHFGCSPVQAIRRHRADRAIARLRRCSDLAEVAHTEGYADQSHMTREFRAIFGLTPAQYRQLF